MSDEYDGGKEKPDSGHPDGRSNSNWFRIVGEKLKPDIGHPDGRSNSNWFRIRRSLGNESRGGEVEPADTG